MYTNAANGKMQTKLAKELMSKFQTVIQLLRQGFQNFVLVSPRVYKPLSKITILQKKTKEIHLFLLSSVPDPHP
jgi:hypothetical protein